MLITTAADGDVVMDCDDNSFSKIGPERDNDEDYFHDSNKDNQIASSAVYDKLITASKSDCNYS